MNGEDRFETVRNTVEEKMGISDITQYLLDYETIGPNLSEEQGKTYQGNIELTLL